MLKIDSLTVAYGKKYALQEVSLAVAPGEIAALIGPNGAGKSSLIRAVSGVIGRRSGHVHFNGQDLLALSTYERARLLAVVPQAGQMGGAFTVQQAVLLGRTPHMNWLGKASRTDLAEARRAMQQTVLEELADRRIAELSGGEQQRVLLARALAQSTPVLLLDEPTTHLDLQHQTTFLNLVRRLAEERGLAVLMALHDLNLVSLCADRVALLVDGQIMAEGVPDEVLTAGNIEEAYQTPVRVVTLDDRGTTVILPQGNK